MAGVRHRATPTTRSTAGQCARRMWPTSVASKLWRALGPPTRASSPTSYIRHQRHEFVDEAASERFESTASMPSMKPQRRAPAPTAMQTSCRVHACLSRVPLLRCCPLPAVRAPCEPPAAGVCIWGVAPVAAPPGGDGGAFGRRLGGAQPPQGLELVPHMRHLARVCYSRLPSVCSQARLCVSRSPPVAAARRPACPVLPLPPRTPPPPSPPALSAAHGHSRERVGRAVVGYWCVHARDVHVEPVAARRWLPAGRGRPRGGPRSRRARLQRRGRPWCALVVVSGAACVPGGFSRLREIFTYVTVMHYRPRASRCGPDTMAVVWSAKKRTSQKSARRGVFEKNRTSRRFRHHHIHTCRPRLRARTRTLR